MEGCFKCGVSGTSVRLFDGLCEEGIVKVCARCSSEEDIFLVKKPSTIELKDYVTKKRVEGIKTSSAGNFKGFYSHPEDSSLKKVIDENFERKHQKAPIGVTPRRGENTQRAQDLGEAQSTEFWAERPKREDLVENFHWLIMRARRKRHLTRRKFAEALAEPESAIVMAEKGVLPKDDNKLVSKIQSYLGVRLIRIEYDLELKERVKANGLNFDPVSVKSLTIADLRELQKERENEEREAENRRSHLHKERGKEEKEAENRRSHLHKEAGKQKSKKTLVETNEGEGELILEEDADSSKEIEIPEGVSDNLGIEDMNELVFRKKE